MYNFYSFFDTIDNFTSYRLWYFQRVDSPTIFEPNREIIIIVISFLHRRKKKKKNGNTAI